MKRNGYLLIGEHTLLISIHQSCPTRLKIFLRDLSCYTPLIRGRCYYLSLYSKKDQGSTRKYFKVCELPLCNVNYALTFELEIDY